MINVRKKLLPKDYILENAAIEEYYKLINIRCKNLICDNKEHNSNGYITATYDFKKRPEIKFEFFCCSDFQNQCNSHLQQS